MDQTARAVGRCGRRHGVLLDQRRHGALFRKPCFAETVDKHPSPLTTTSYRFRYSQIGLNLQEPGHRLPGFCISPQVSSPMSGNAQGQLACLKRAAFGLNGSRINLKRRHQA
jgi:hypothetical protein